jgi:PAS domain S-box-containing protein
MGRNANAPHRISSIVSIDAFVDEVLDYAIIGLDPGGHILSWNKGAQHIKGYGAEEIIGEHFSRFYPDDAVQAGRPERALEVASTTGRLEEEAWRIRKDGGRFWASVVLTAVRDDRGQLRGFIKIVRDLTERREADANSHRLAIETAAREAAQESQIRLKFLADAGAALAESLDHIATLARVARLAVPILADWCAVSVADEEGAFRRVAVVHRDPAKRELARTYQERFPPYRHPESEPLAILLSGQPVFLPVVEESVLQGWTQGPEHMEILRALGVRSCMMVPLVARGRMLGVLTLVRSDHGREYDRDDLALAQELATRAALAVENAHLFERERKATADAQAQRDSEALARGRLEALTQELQQAVQLRDNFLSVASHELKTPLTPMLIRLHTLVRAMESQPDAPFTRQVRLYTETAGRQIQKLVTLINDLLDVSRIAAGRFRLEREQLDLVTVVRDVAGRFEIEANRAGSPLTLDLPAALPMQSDALRLEQVVTNLVDNAIKYGSGRPIEVRLRNEGDQAVLVVRDQGIGIPPEFQPRIFERFERAVSERHYGGLGLGLYITRTIVDALGGSIAVSSREGQGATFTVKLPLGPLV